ncbi:MAG: DMT family transporter [Oscillospiraceae bacterium]|nr:DMT family transporter [Oscillospiraceae bacterium]
MRKSRIHGYLYVLISAAIFGFTPWVVKHLYAEGMSTMSVVLWRNIFSLPFLALLAFLQNKTLKIPAKALPKVSLTALLGGCATPVLLYLSYRFMPTGSATLFHYIYPALVVLGCVLLKEENYKGGNLISVAFCIVGVCLFYAPGHNVDWRGAMPALASGLTYAIYIILLSHNDTRSVPGFLFSFYMTLISSVVLLILCLIFGQLTVPATGGSWGILVLFSIAVTIGAVALFQLGTFLIGGRLAAVCSSLEPLLAVLVGFLVFHEPLDQRTIIGGCFVLCGYLIIAFTNKAKKKS